MEGSVIRLRVLHRGATDATGAIFGMANPIEVIKREKHGFDVWPDVLAHARRQDAA